MTTLLLESDPGTGSNRLTITPTADVTRIRRSDANGTWDVRTLTGQLPYTGPAPLVLDDYEAVNGTSTYTVTTAGGTVTDSIVLALTSPIVSVPEAPNFSARVPSVLEYGANTNTLSTVHEPDGRPGPVVIVMGGSTRRGNLSLEGGDYAAALNLLRLFQRGMVMQLRQTDHPGMDMYFMAMRSAIVTSTNWGRASQFDVEVEYIETDRPAGALAGALGWTWPAVEADYATWGDVFDAYASWGDLRIDKRKP
jgi:hypothetical protein